MTQARQADLANWFDAADRAAQTLHPLFYWAQLTGFAGFRQGPRSAIRVTIELRDQRAGLAMVQLHRQGHLRIARRYLEDLQHPQRGRLFFTARVSVSHLANLARRGDILRIEPAFLAGQPSMAPPERIWLGHLSKPAFRPATVLALLRAMAHGGLQGVDGADILQSMRRVEARSVRTRSRASTRPVMGVIDFGCAFGHPSLQSRSDPSRTRVCWLWDQGRSAAAPPGSPLWPWVRPDDLAYGREASGEKLDALMRSVQHAARQAAAGEQIRPSQLQDAYAMAAGLPELLLPWSHGTAVLGLAAGWPLAQAHPDEAPDAAADADIVFVQLPQDAVNDQSGGWVTSYVLDGIEYILARARGRPAVINISVGSYAGSHDGQSLMERALTHVARHPGVKLVMAAGNGAGRKGHAVAELKPGQQATLHWAVPGDDPTQSFLELWYQLPDDRQGPHFELSHGGIIPLECNTALAAPIHRRSGVQQPAGAWVHVPQAQPGTSAGRLFLALAPTAEREAQAAGLAAAPAGLWSIKVVNRSSNPLRIHAYIERDEVGQSPLGGRPDSVLHAANESPWKVREGGTLTAQSTATGVLAVGALVRAGGVGAGRPVDLAAYSSRGGDRLGQRQDVDVLAPGDERIEGLDRGLVVLSHDPQAGARDAPSGSRSPLRLSGTSLAAPWMARQEFNALAATSPSASPPGTKPKAAGLPAPRAASSKPRPVP